MRVYMRVYGASSSQDLTLKLEEYNKKKWSVDYDSETNSIIARHTISRAEQVVSVIGFAILNFFTLGLNKKLKGELRDRIKKEEAVQIRLKSGSDSSIRAIFDQFAGKTGSKSSSSSASSEEPSKSGSGNGALAKKPKSASKKLSEGTTEEPPESPSEELSKEQVKAYLQNGDQKSLHTLYSYMVEANFDQWDAFEPTDMETIDFVELMQRAKEKYTENSIVDKLFGFPVISLQQQNLLQKVSGNNLKAIKDKLRILHLGALTEKQEKERVKFDVHEALEKGGHHFINTVSFFMVSPHFEQWDLIKPTDIEEINFVELMQRAKDRNTEKSIIHHLFGEQVLSTEQKNRLQMVTGKNLKAIYPHFKSFHHQALTEKQRQEIE